MAKNINVWYERDMSRWEGECNGHKAHGDSEEEVRRQLLEDTCADGYEVDYNLNLDEMKRRNAEEKKRRRIQEKLEEAEQEKRWKKLWKNQEIYDTRRKKLLSKSKLNELERTFIKTPTQEEYDGLMTILEFYGWNGLEHNRWISYDVKPTETKWWWGNDYKKNTCINAKNGFNIFNIHKLKSLDKLISIQEFYEAQRPKLTDDKIKEINQLIEQEKLNWKNYCK